MNKAIMSPRQAMNAPLEVMDEEELKYVLAYASGEVMRAAQNGPELDFYERRRKAAEDEIWRRRK